MNEDETIDDWPLDYRPGPAKHLHALGVIALQFAPFQASMERVYLNQVAKLNVPDDLGKLYYFSLDEEKRIKATSAVFKDKPDPAVREYVENLLKYFQWCQQCRNQLLHCELYPAGIFTKKDTLYLMKRKSKTSTQSGYVKLTLSEVRDIADKMRKGVWQSATLILYLRFRKRDPSTLKPEFRELAKALPEKLAVPQTLELSLRP